MFTCVFPPVLSCMAVLERAVLAANDRKDAPNMLLAPKAMSSCGWLDRYIKKLFPKPCIRSFNKLQTNLVSINEIFVFDGVDFSYWERYSKSYYSHREGLHCSLLHDFKIWCNWRFISNINREMLFLWQKSLYSSILDLLFSILIFSPSHHLANHDHVKSLFEIESIGDTAGYNSLICTNWLDLLNIFYLNVLMYLYPPW